MLESPIRFVEPKNATATLVETCLPVLDDLATLLSERTELEKIAIRVHTDKGGPRAINKKLTTAQATLVRDYLVQKGIAAERFVVESIGEDQPLPKIEGEEDTPERHQRVEFVVLARAAAPGSEAAAGGEGP